MKVTYVISGVLMVALFTLWQLWPPDRVSGDSADADQVARGRIVYLDQCARCHGQNLEGQPDWKVRRDDGKLPAPPHDPSGHTWHHSDKQLFQITKLGIRPPLVPEGYENDMPGFQDAISDADIWSVLAYIKSTWPETIRRRQAELSKGKP